MLRTLGTRLARSSGLSSVRGLTTSTARLADGGGDAAASDKQRIEVRYACTSGLTETTHLTYVLRGAAHGQGSAF